MPKACRRKSGSSFWLTWSRRCSLQQRGRSANADHARHAFTIAQNLGAGLHDFTTVNIDVLTHYRPTVNVVQRPAGVGGRGYTVNGRHELLVPLLAFALVDAIDGRGE